MNPAAQGRISMGKGKNAEAKTSRILSTYHFFLYCEEVEFNTLCKAFSISKKTAYRDIRLLEQAGLLEARFDKTRMAIVADNLEPRPMEHIENETRRKYAEKIRRLGIFMSELDALGENDNPIALYRRLFPPERERTRQRDFSELRKLGYILSYSGAGKDEPGGWFVQIPPAFFLATIPNDVNWW